MSVVESRSVLGIGFSRAAASTPDCDSVHGVVGGDTCSAIAQEFSLSTEDFNAINPNLDCDNLFVGQWLCVAGTSNN
ncbi:unnamed protein product [Dovyalis caffra]|uniref:LysM domain-containing protein n=1 Tax=Dovyalis caffra TaxID=77055 RepID=A0AAV1S841_9ROSI|nr:unnamed protein product [Dovyalis caffra]